MRASYMMGPMQKLKIYVFLSLFLSFIPACQAHWDRDMVPTLGNSIEIAPDSYVRFALIVFSGGSPGPLQVTKVSAAECQPAGLCRVVVKPSDRHGSLIELFPLKAGSGSLRIAAYHPWRHKTEELTLSVSIVPNSFEVLTPDDTKIPGGRIRTQVRIDGSKLGTAYPMMSCTDAHLSAFRSVGFNWSSLVHEGTKTFFCQPATDGYFVDSVSDSVSMNMGSIPVCVSLRPDMRVAAISLYEFKGGQAVMVGTIGKPEAGTCVLNEKPPGARQ